MPLSEQQRSRRRGERRRRRRRRQEGRRQAQGRRQDQGRRQESREGLAAPRREGGVFMFGELYFYILLFIQ